MKSLTGPGFFFRASMCLRVRSVLSPTSRPTMVSGQPAWNTICAASGSLAMFASAAAFTFPPVIEPPMITTSFTSGTIEGSFSIASAILVSGPIGTSVISWGLACTISMIRSGAQRGSFLHLLGGSSTFASPFCPCQNSAVINFWNSGCCAPAATRMSQRFASDTIRSAFSNPCAAVTFPGTTVNARTSNSGEFSASMIAIASSVPGSVSIITFRGPATASEPRAQNINARKPTRLNRNIVQLPLLVSFAVFSLPDFFFTSLFPLTLGHNNQRQPEQKACKHRSNVAIRSLRGVAELFPDKHAPDRGNHRCALTQPVGDRKARAPGRDDVERHSDSPDNSAENSRQVGSQAALEIIGERNRGADKRFLHDECAQNEIAEENSNGKNENRRVRPELPRLRRGKVRIHRRGNEAVKE